MTDHNRTDKWYDKGKLRPYFNGKLRGYPGLAATAKQIAEYIPTSEVYVEPFAGLGRVAKHVQWLKFCVLNDKSEYAAEHNRKYFPDATVTQEDWTACIKIWDSPETFFLIDPPWSKTMYQKNFENNTDDDGKIIIPFCDRSAGEYYSQIFALLPKLKGNWILCMNHKRKAQAGYFEKIVESTKTIMTYHIKTKCISNLPFIKRGAYIQQNLF